MVFKLCKIDPDIQFHLGGQNHYDNITVCLDDLLITFKDPKITADILTNKHSLKVKGTGPIYFNLGCYFGRDDDSSPHFEPRNHIETIDECHHSMFGSKFKLKILSTLEKGNHHDLDTSEFIDSDSIQKCQLTIGAIQRSVSSGSFDVNTEGIALACFRSEPM